LWLCCIFHFGVKLSAWESWCFEHWRTAQLAQWECADIGQGEG